MALKEQEITGLIQRKRLVRIYVRWEFLVQNARIMNGSFCGVTSGQRGRSACGCVSKPTGMRHFRGLAAGLACFHIYYLKLCERPCRSRISLRKEGEVALLKSPNGLGATARISNA